MTLEACPYSATPFRQRWRYVSVFLAILSLGLTLAAVSARIPRLTTGATVRTSFQHSKTQRPEADVPQIPTPAFSLEFYQPDALDPLISFTAASVARHPLGATLYNRPPPRLA